MTDYKQLCAELVEQLDDALDFTVSGETKRHMKLLTGKARAALAEAEPEGELTDEELSFIYHEGSQGAWNPQNAHYDGLRAVEAAVLARWGRPAPEPIPVSARLPGAEDCDAEGRCWLGGSNVVDGTPTWLFGYSAWAERFPRVHRYWLPAHALPLPSKEVDGCKA